MYSPRFVGINYGISFLSPKKFPLGLSPNIYESVWIFLKSAKPYFLPQIINIPPPSEQLSRKDRNPFPRMCTSLLSLTTLRSLECTFFFHFNQLSCFCYLCAVLHVCPWIPSHDKTKNLWPLLWICLGQGPMAWGLPSSPGNIFLMTTEG